MFYFQRSFNTRCVPTVSGLSAFSCGEQIILKKSKNLGKKAIVSKFGAFHPFGRARNIGPGRLA